MLYIVIKNTSRLYIVAISALAEVMGRCMGTSYLLALPGVALNAGMTAALMKMLDAGKMLETLLDSIYCH